MIEFDEIKTLTEQVRTRMSEKRFLHTLGVAKFAEQMGRDLALANTDELFVCGLLHDLAKEMPRNTQIEILKMPSPVYTFKEEDLLSETLYHGFCAPYLILRDFPRFAKEDILNAVCYHTVGREGMSLFEKIVFLADYIEDGRTYQDCVNVRNYYLENIQTVQNKERLINECMLMTLDNTLAYLIRNKYYISPRTLFTRNSILAELSLV